MPGRSRPHLLEMNACAPVRELEMLVGQNPDAALACFAWTPFEQARRAAADTTPPESGARPVAPWTEYAGAHLVLPEQPRYEPIRSLGVGGMGEVTLALDRDIGRLVAVKRLLPDADAMSARRFAEEIRTLGRIDHPNVVPLYDAGVDGEGQPFLVMKHVDGETLASIIGHLRDRDPAYAQRFPIERRVAIFVDVLRALQAAHEKGILHRDVKPSNVMVGRSGEVVLMDWGIAKSFTSTVSLIEDAADEARPRDLEATRAGAVVGSAPYVSPEQACGRNSELDARSDLYSATVLFHELLTLDHYLGARGSASEMLLAVIGEEVSFADLARDGSAAPPELRRFIAKGLAKRRAERFQSAAEMIDILEDVQAARTSIVHGVALARRELRGLSLIARAYMVLAMLFVTVIPWRFYRGAVSEGLSTRTRATAA